MKKGVLDFLKIKSCEITNFYKIRECQRKSVFCTVFPFFMIRVTEENR